MKVRKSTKLKLRQLSALFFVPAFTVFSLAASHHPSLRVSGSESLSAHEQHLWRIPVHNSQFADIRHAPASPFCEATLPPQALATPDPLLDDSEPSIKIKVSFIVGTDGRVHRPILLESAGPTQDHAVLETVRAWRYRPAMCNGVPTETEGKIEFSSR
jgi:TonB family protein